MKNNKTGMKALLTGTSRRSATLKHQKLNKYCECDVQVISDVYKDKVYGNIEPLKEDSDPCELNKVASPKNYISYNILERRRLTFVTKWKSSLESKYCSWEQNSRADRIGCDN